ncbi:MAG: 2-oxoglutarate dehydrogenase complex dihydrolipoyllysine-residue succinyltransferase [Thermomicrobiales bacterium]|nr:2-oxoglutarate dehydrogenase complex dihydrolipoyllysine-residue succinyltransferase [Thermomicrobiales bacterium]
MSIEIRVPPLGESLVDAVVGAWLKGEGEAVSRGDVLVELETDKVNLEVAATDDGVLGKIERQAGDVVTVGEVLGLIADGAGAPAAAKPAEKPVEAPAPVAAAAPAPAAPAPAAPAPAPRAAEPAADGGRAAPAVRMLASELGVDLNSLTGTGPGGRVTREDVFIAAERVKRNGSVAPSAPAPQAAPAAPAAAHAQEERIRMSRRRQTIANRLVEAQQTAAMLTTFNEVDLTAVMELRAKRKDAFKEKHGVNLGFMSFFTKAVVGALKAYPRLNAEIQGDEMVLKKHYDIGIAVGAEEGLVVPVVREADRLSFAEIEQRIVTLAGKARDNKLTLDELTGGTFTITNGGIFGSMLSTPILNTPQVGILGMHAIQQRPVARDGEVVIRPMMYTALSYDHRIVDGREAVLFLVKVKELLEDPTNLLLEG